MCFSNLIQVRAEIDHWLLVSWVPGEKTSSVHCNLCDLVKHVNLLGDESYLHIEFTYLSIPNTYIILYLYIYIRKQEKTSWERPCKVATIHLSLNQITSGKTTSIGECPLMSPPKRHSSTICKYEDFERGNLWESIGIRRLFKSATHTQKHTDLEELQGQVFYPSWTNQSWRLCFFDRRKEWFTGRTFLWWTWGKVFFFFGGGVGGSGTKLRCTNCKP